VGGPPLLPPRIPFNESRSFSLPLSLALTPSPSIPSRVNLVHPPPFFVSTLHPHSSLVTTVGPHPPPRPFWDSWFEPVCHCSHHFPNGLRSRFCFPFFIFHQPRPPHPNRDPTVHFSGRTSLFQFEQFFFSPTLGFFCTFWARGDPFQSHSVPQLKTRFYPFKVKLCNGFLESLPFFFSLPPSRFAQVFFFFLHLLV